MDIPEIVQFAAALLFVLALIILIAWALRRFFGASAARSSQPAGRRRSRRLGVIEATPIGNRHRLVLVRRDDVEHLLLIGGSSEVVVERSIPTLDAEAEVNIRSMEPRFESAPGHLGAPVYEEPPYQPTSYEPTIPRTEPPPRPAAEERELPEPEPEEPAAYRFSRAAPTAEPRGYSDVEGDGQPEEEEQGDALSDLAARYSGRVVEDEGDSTSYEREGAFEPEEDEPAERYEIDDTGEEPPEPQRRESPILSRFLNRDER